MQKHEWRERDEDGLRFFRAEHHAGNWRLASKGKDEEEWREHDPISPGEWRKLRELLFNKYQRRRVPWELVEKIDKRLEEEGDD